MMPTMPHDLASASTQLTSQFKSEESVALRRALAVLASDCESLRNQQAGDAATRDVFSNRTGRLLQGLEQLQKLAELDNGIQLREVAEQLSLMISIAQGHQAVNPDFSDLMPGNASIGPKGIVKPQVPATAEEPVEEPAEPSSDPVKS